MATFQDTPMAWWDDEPVFEGGLTGNEASTPAGAGAAKAAEEPDTPTQALKPKNSKRGSLLSPFRSPPKQSTDEQADQPKDLILIHCGWVTKQGHLVANWKKRFLRLVIDNRAMPRTATLAYYKASDLGERAERFGEQGFLPLAAATVVSGLPSFGFKVTTAAGKAYPFRAESAGEREDWVLKIQETIAACLLLKDKRGSLVTTASQVAAETSEINSAPPTWLSDHGK